MNLIEGRVYGVPPVPSGRAVAISHLVESQSLRPPSVPSDRAKIVNITAPSFNRAHTLS